MHWMVLDKCVGCGAESQREAGGSWKQDPNCCKTGLMLSGQEDSPGRGKDSS